MLFATYGVSDNFDFGIAVPFVHVDLDARVDGRIFRTASGANSPTHSFDTAGADRATFTESGSSNGLGDLSIRAKYNFLRGDVTSFAAGLDLRLPTGDKDELLGTGATRAEMMFIYSGDYGRVSPHVNIGYTLSSGESSSAASQLDVDEDDHRLDTIVGPAAGRRRPGRSGRVQLRVRPQRRGPPEGDARLRRARPHAVRRLALRAARQRLPEPRRRSAADGRRSPPRRSSR